MSCVFQFKDPKHHFVKVKSQKAQALCSEASLPELLCTAHTVQRRHQRVQSLSADESCLRGISRELETRNDYQAPWFLFFLAYWTSERAVVLKWNHSLWQLPLSLILHLRLFCILEKTWFPFALCSSSATPWLVTKELLNCCFGVEREITTAAEHEPARCPGMREGQGQPGLYQT